MAIDLLGNEAKKVKKEPAKIEYHQPEKAAIAEQKVTRPPVPAVSPSASQEELQPKEEVDLLKGFKISSAGKKVILILFLILVIVSAGIIYYLVTQGFFQPRNQQNLNLPAIVNLNTNLPAPLNENLNLIAPLNENLNLPVNLNLPEIGNINVNINETPPVIPEPLPNTPLTPLRGALVKFAGRAEIYLVENNGELRLINQATVYFKDGQFIKNIKQDIIYTINASYKDVRQGKPVSGFVDWDPRILTVLEIESFK